MPGRIEGEDAGCWHTQGSGRVNPECYNQRFYYVPTCHVLLSCSKVIALLCDCFYPHFCLRFSGRTLSGPGGSLEETAKEVRRATPNVATQRQRSPVHCRTISKIPSRSLFLHVWSNFVLFPTASHLSSRIDVTNLNWRLDFVATYLRSMFPKQRKDDLFVFRWRRGEGNASLSSATTAKMRRSSNCSTESTMSKTVAWTFL